MSSLSTNNQEEQVVPASPLWEKIVAVVFGLGFLMVMLGFSVVFPEPTPTQYDTFKTVLALAAAGFAAVLPGVIHIDLPLPKGVVRASGAVVLFVIVYFFPPAAPESKDITVTQTINAEYGTQVGENHGVMNIGVAQEKGSE